MGTLRRLSLLTAAIAAVWSIAPAPGVAQIKIPLFEEPSPSPSPSPSSSSSREPTASPTPSSSPTRGTSGGSGGGGGDSKPRGGSQPKKSTVPATPADPVVEKGLSLWRERERSPARTTTRLLQLLDQAHATAGEPTPAEVRAAFGRFPVVGYVWYQDDYGAPRFKPYYSAHEGNDLFAVRGTPVIAVADGHIWRMGSFSKGGKAIWLMGDDGVRYYYGHLDRFAAGMKTGKRLRLGELIGFVGNSGNAVGTYPHVHFEINPGGLGTVNPKPILDRWLDDAESAMLSRLRDTRQRVRLSTLGGGRWNRLMDLFAEDLAPPPALWTAGLGGSGLLAPLDAALAELLAMHRWEPLAVHSAGASGEEVTPLDPVAALLGDAHELAGHGMH